MLGISLIIAGAMQNNVNTLAYPIINFQVQLLNYKTIYASKQPDKVANIVYGLQHATVQIPGIVGNLVDQATFTLNGPLALKVKSIYATGANAPLVVVSSTP